MPSRSSRHTRLSQTDLSYWSELSERSKSLETYTSVLKEADRQSIAQVANFAERIDNFYKGLLVGYTITLVIVTGIFITSLILVTTASSSDFQKTFGAIGIPASIIVLLILLYRTPLRSARQTVGEIIKMQIVYLGYLRQINQIDIGFKHTFVNTKRTTLKQFQDTFAETQKIVDNALDEINLLLDELD